MIQEDNQQWYAWYINIYPYRKQWKDQYHVPQDQKPEPEKEDQYEHEVWVAGDADDPPKHEEILAISRGYLGTEGGTLYRDGAGVGREGLDMDSK